MGHSLAVLAHLYLAAGLSLQAGDLLPPAADDEPHHVVRDHHLLRLEGEESEMEPKAPKFGDQICT